MSDGLGQLNLYIHTSSQIELHQRINGCGVGLHDIEQPLVGADLKLLTRLFVDVRSTVDAEFFDSRRQRNGATYQRASAARGISDFASCLVEHAMVKRLEANANILGFHVHYR